MFAAQWRSAQPLDLKRALFRRSASSFSFSFSPPPLLLSAERHESRTRTQVVATVDGVETTAVPSPEREAGHGVGLGVVWR